ncbi:MAG: hypothetical protein HN742_20990 [Lentisphaerae bacterium]|jgi:hypothetical protein|nr:hypothetical protein [Lentisphaerota bacterium]MBT4819861.1 hypothetical protein [Lentisphaerota bacterium]MBT5607601.1 hypothetical protein [Lentisphaerota bacterium]MBT7054610.1 hypothetical protein [Lentisphaerota bacterium]MBT7844368.1 hypothetical protein [Lentisphaerota bacterium]
MRYASTFGILACWVAFGVSVRATGGVPGDLVTNGGFESGLAGWEPRSIAGGGLCRCEADAEQRHDGTAALRVFGNGAKAGVHQAVTADLSTCRTLAVSYWGRLMESPDVTLGAHVAIGVDLGIRLTSGKTVWFLPASFCLGFHDTGRWVRKRAWYRVPDGEAIAGLTVHCINYRNRGSAWFDDVRVTALAEPDGPSDLCLVEPSTDRGAANHSVLLSRFEALKRPFSRIPPLTPVPAGGLLVLSDCPEDEGFYRWVRDHVYTVQGRVLACGLEEHRVADGLRGFLWGEKRLREATRSPDGRCAYFPGTADVPQDLSVLVGQLLSSKESLPEILPAQAVSGTREAVIRDSRLWVEGKPRLIRAMGAYRVEGPESYGRDLREYAELGLNAVAAYIRPDLPPSEFGDFLNMAEANGLLVIAWFQISRPVRESGGIPWRARWLLPFLEYRKHPALLSWLMSDDTADRHFPVIHRIHELVTRYDTDNLTTATCFGYRYPERFSPNRWERWQGIMDYPTTYDYPLNKDGVTWKPSICVGLEDIQKLCANVQAVQRGDAYFHLWAQSHLQTHVRRKLGLATFEQFLTSPEQTRLLTYMMLSSGARGILYFHAGAFREDVLGMGRRHELGIVWHELAPFEDLLAAGRREQLLATGPDGVEAVAFRGEESTLLLLTKHGRTYHRYVWDGGVPTLNLAVPWDGVGKPSAFAVDYPTVEPLACSLDGAGLMVEVPAGDLTRLILITAVAKRVELLRRQRSEGLRNVAGWAYSVARDKAVKTRCVLSAIESQGGEIRDDVRALQEAGELLLRRSSVRSPSEGEAAEALRRARGVLETFRQVQATCVQAAESAWKEGGRAEGELPYLNTYYTLPSFYRMRERQVAVAAGELGHVIRKALKADQAGGIPKR